MTECGVKGSRQPHGRLVQSFSNTLERERKRKREKEREREIETIPSGDSLQDRAVQHIRVYIIFFLSFYLSLSLYLSIALFITLSLLPLYIQDLMAYKNTESVDTSTAGSFVSRKSRPRNPGIYPPFI
eukprot:sb/3475339/